MDENNNIRIIDKSDEIYPSQLLLIKDPPKNLYCIGDVSLLSTRMAAVVGSRKCSEYGKKVAMNLGKILSEAGLTVVSGMAKGIDNFGHLGALKNGGKTIAVLGCGADVCYPKENRRLYEEIAEKGLIISEYPSGTQPMPYAFPLRNRIISGLSEAVTVVEAGTNSGALITAELAAEQGKLVYAVPGNITSTYSLGSNKLLCDGAMALAVLDDILVDLNVKRSSGQSDKEKINLSEAERQVFEAVASKGEVTIDYLCGILAKKPYEVSGIVAVLEIKGLVANSFGKIFIANL